MEQNNYTAKTGNTGYTRSAALRTLLTACLLVAACFGAHATTYLWVDDYEVTKSVTLTVGTSSKANIAKGTVTFDATTKTLTLDNVVMYAKSVNGISLKATGITIIVKGRCDLDATNKSGYALKMGNTGLTATIKGYNSSANLNLVGESDASGLYLDKNCNCIVENLEIACTGKYGIRGVNGTSNEKLTLNKGTDLYLRGDAQAVINLATLSMDSSLGIATGRYYETLVGSFSTAKHSIVDSNGIVAKDVFIKTLMQYGLRVMGREVTNLNCKYFYESGTGYIIYDPDTKTLRLSGVSASGNIPLVENTGCDGLTISLYGKNEYTFSATSAITMHKNTTISGSGSLTLSAPTSSKYAQNAIEVSGSNAKLTLANSGSLYLRGDYGVDLVGAGSKMGVTATGTVEMYGLKISNGECEASFTGTGRYTIKASHYNYAVYLDSYATSSKLTIGDVSNMSINCDNSTAQSYGIRLDGIRQSVTIGATKNLVVSASYHAIWMRLDRKNSLTFNKSDVTLKGTYPLDAGSGCEIKLNDCDVATEGVYFDTNKGSFLPGTPKTVQLKPVTAKYGIFFGDRQLNDLNCKSFSASGLKDGSKVSYNPTTKVLKMENVKMDWGEDKYPALDIYSASGIYIDLYGTNELSYKNKDYAAFRVRGTTTLRSGNSTGTLNVRNWYGVEMKIENATSLTVKDVKLLEVCQIDGDGNSYLTIDNSTVKMQGSNHSGEATIQQLKSLTLKNCYIDSPQGIRYDATSKRLLDQSGSLHFGAVTILPGQRPLDADVNGDGQVDKKDVAALMRYIGGRTTGITKAKADVNGDGRVTVADIIAVTQAIAGK